MAPAAPASAEPKPVEKTESLFPEKPRYTPQLYDFLDGLGQSYRDAGENDQADRIREARVSLEGAHVPAAALAEVYLFSNSWETQVQSLTGHPGADPASEDEAMANFYGSRQIFMENCALAYPYIPLIDRAEVKPQTDEALADTNHQIDDLVLRLEESIAKKALVQLNIDVEQVYRLQVLKNQLEKEVHQGGNRPAPKTEVPPQETASPPVVSPEKSLEDLKREAQENWDRLELSEHLGVTMDQWIAEGMLREPDVDVFGDDLQRWRALETSFHNLRDWFSKFEVPQKPAILPQLYIKLSGILKQL